MWFAVIVDDEGCFFNEPEYFGMKDQAVKHAKGKLNDLPSSEYTWVIYRMVEEETFEKP